MSHLYNHFILRASASPNEQPASLNVRNMTTGFISRKYFEITFKHKHKINIDISGRICSYTPLLNKVTSFFPPKYVLYWSSVTIVCFAYFLPTPFAGATGLKGFVMFCWCCCCCFVVVYVSCHRLWTWYILLKSSYIH